MNVSLAFLFYVYFFLIFILAAFTDGNSFFFSCQNCKTRKRWGINLRPASSASSPPFAPDWYYCQPWIHWWLARFSRRGHLLRDKPR